MNKLSNEQKPVRFVTTWFTPQKCLQCRNLKKQTISICHENNQIVKIEIVTIRTMVVLIRILTLSFFWRWFFQPLEHQYMVISGICVKTVYLYIACSELIYIQLLAEPLITGFNPSLNFFSLFVCKEKHWFPPYLSIRKISKFSQSVFLAVDFSQLSVWWDFLCCWILYSKRYQVNSIPGQVVPILVNSFALWDNVIQWESL